MFANVQMRERATIAFEMGQPEETETKQVAIP